MSPTCPPIPVEFQTLEQWEADPRGLLPVEATMMVALPELDGATVPMVFGGRSGEERDMVAHPERSAALAGRVARLVALRRTERAERRVGIVLFNFPPNAGATGTAAYLSVFPSLLNVLRAMRAAGYQVDVPEDAEALRAAVTQGNATCMAPRATSPCAFPPTRMSPPSRICARSRRNGARRRAATTATGGTCSSWAPGWATCSWGCSPPSATRAIRCGCCSSAGSRRRMRSARSTAGCGRISRRTRLLHFGTHGALEFMPGKQAGLSGACWPDRLIGDLPNVNLYASNNPSEGMIAKRRPRRRW